MEEEEEEERSNWRGGVGLWEGGEGKKRGVLGLNGCGMVTFGNGRKWSGGLESECRDFEAVIFMTSSQERVQTV